jgi:hypothetical protein
MCRIQEKIARHIKKTVWRDTATSEPDSDMLGVLESLVHEFTITMLNMVRELMYTMDSTW